MYCVDKVLNVYFILSLDVQETKSREKLIKKSFFFKETAVIEEKF